MRHASKILIGGSAKQPIRTIAEGPPFKIRNFLNPLFNRWLQSDLPNHPSHNHHIKHNLPRFNHKKVIDTITILDYNVVDAITL